MNASKTMLLLIAVGGVAFGVWYFFIRKPAAGRDPAGLQGQQGLSIEDLHKPPAATPTLTDVRPVYRAPPSTAQPLPSPSVPGPQPSSLTQPPATAVRASPVQQVAAAGTGVLRAGANLTVASTKAVVGNWVDTAKAPINIVRQAARGDIVGAGKSAILAPITTLSKLNPFSW